MIDLSQGLIFELLLKAFLLGVALGVFYDAIRFFKMICGVEYFGAGAGKRKRGVTVQESGAEGQERGVAGKIFRFAVTFLSDLIFWLVFGVSSIILLYNISGGVFRASIYPCMLFGFLLYYFSLGRLVLILSHNVVIILKKVAFFILRALLVPLSALRRFFIFLYHLTIGKIVGKIKERINLSREKRRIAEAVPAELDGREEECENVDEGHLYRRDGRINFGSFGGSA